MEIKTINYDNYFHRLDGKLPYLGAVKNEIAVSNVLELPLDTRIARIMKPFKNFKEIINFKRIERIELTQLTEEWVDLLSLLPNLKYLTLSYCKKQTELPDIAKLKSLKALVISSCKQLESLKFLREQKSLTSLCISECKYITDLSPLKHLSSNLEELWLDGPIGSSPQKVKSIDPIGKLINLKFLLFMLSIQKENKTLHPLLKLRKLNYLMIRHFGYKRSEFDSLVNQIDTLDDIHFNGGMKWSTTSKK